MLDTKTLESWLWDAACQIRGAIDAPKYKDYILPLIFLKRLSDMYDDEFARLKEYYGNEKTAAELVREDHTLVRFYLPENTRWESILNRGTALGQYLTDAVKKTARENPRLSGVIDMKDFNETAGGQRIISDEKLKLLINSLNKHRLGLDDVEPDILGRAYEYLLRKFAEGSGQSAGEFYTPREVAILMAAVIDPREGEEVYDPCLGSGGLLIKCYLQFRKKYGDDPRVKPLQFYGQEISHTTWAMAKMNAFIHQMEAEISLGDSLNRPAFLTPSGALRKFDIVLANPMWNQNFPQNTYENDPYGRFTCGYPPSSTADWGWIQHMFASLSNRGRMAVVLDTGAVSRGSGNAGSNRERDIRRAFVENDSVETVILLPENLFYNTTAPGIILFLNRNKKRTGEILFVNASPLFEKGRPKNFLPDESIRRIAEVCLTGREAEGVSILISTEEAARNDYNLSPSRYVRRNGGETVLPLEEAVVLVREAEEERAEADRKLREVLGKMGIEL